MLQDIFCQKFTSWDILANKAERAVYFEEQLRRDIGRDQGA